MKPKRTAVAVLVLLGAPLVGFAQCTGVQSLPYLVPDGTAVVETIPESGVRQLIARLNAGRSYSLQATTPEVRGGTQPYTLTLCDLANFGGGNATDTTSTDPPILNDETLGAPHRAGRRLSIVVSSSGLFSFDFTNTDPQNAHTFTVVLVETTLFNPLWSTFGGFETFYRIQNATNASCNVTLRMVNDAGTQVANANLMIAANSTAPTRNTGPTDLNIANDQAGQSIITHDCPPGAIQVDGFLGRFDLAAPVVLPIKIVAARETR